MLQVDSLRAGGFVALQSDSRVCVHDLFTALAGQHAPPASLSWEQTQAQPTVQLSTTARVLQHRGFQSLYLTQPVLHSLRALRLQGVELVAEQGCACRRL